jgi:phage tail-like protein
MPAPRPFALIRTHDQWFRASYENTALQGEVVQLSWNPGTAPEDEKPDPFLFPGSGLAFDSYCRLYHSVTGESGGRIERLLWATHDPLQPGDSQRQPVDLIDDDQGGLNKPLGLAVDQDDRLFVAESGTRSILVFDLWSKRLLVRVQLKSEPLDLVAKDRSVYALLKSPPHLLRVDARGNVQTLSWPDAIVNPSRLALAPNGDLFILENAGDSLARVVNYNKPAETISVKFATDVEFQTGDALLAESCGGENQVLVVARRPDEDFRRFCVGKEKPSELTPIKARAYDGLGIVRVPDGRIGFWTNRGFRHAVAATLKYRKQGSVTTYRLDSKEFHTTWGRLFIDACIPKGTRIEVRCITADEPPEGQDVPRRSPENTTANPSHQELSPLPPKVLVDRALLTAAQSLHRRETGKELPWVRARSGDSFETYEAPVIAQPGRYLWVILELTGNSRTTPRLRALRAEYPTHDYLKRLPKTLSRDESVARFLQRYLAIFEGVLGELEAEADARATLLDPRSAPAEILPWLASFLGLALDERMARAPRPGGKTEDVRRRLIAEAIWLFRFRGTIAGLSRFIEIYLDRQPIILEKFRFRGMGGVLLGEGVETSNSVLGGGFRIGGAIGLGETQELDTPPEDAFATHAHRFSLVVPAQLTSEQRDVVQQILDLHRPSHTLVEICTLGAGMRVGRGLHVALTSIIGRSGGFDQLQLGNSTIGRGSVLGRALPGTVVGKSKLGEDSRPG